MQKLKRKPTTKEIARKMRVSIDKINMISSLITRVASLESPVGEDDSGQFLDLIEDRKAASPDGGVANLLRSEKIQELLDTMKPREKDVITLRYGLKDGNRQTLAEIAKHFKITRERVRQIERAALKKLKKRWGQDVEQEF